MIPRGDRADGNAHNPRVVPISSAGYVVVGWELHIVHSAASCWRASFQADRSIGYSPDVLRMNEVWTWWILLQFASKLYYNYMIYSSVSWTRIIKSAVRSRLPHFTWHIIMRTIIIIRCNDEKWLNHEYPRIPGKRHHIVHCWRARSKIRRCSVRSFVCDIGGGPFYYYYNIAADRL